MRLIGDSLPDIGQQFDEVIGGDLAAVLAIEGGKLPIHIQTTLAVLKHLPGRFQKYSHQD